MARSVDCLVLGYDDDTERLFARLATAAPDSVEHRTFLRNHVTIDGVRSTYMDALNHVVGRGPRWRGAATRPFYHVGEVTNLAALYLTSYLRERGCAVEMIGLVSAERDALLAVLGRGDGPAVVAITTTFYEDESAVAHLTRLVKDHCPGAVVVAGGPLVQNLFHDLDPAAFQATLLAMGADVYVHEVEGEETLLALVRAVRTGTDLGAVPNLFVRTRAAVAFTFARREQNPLDECAVNWSRVPETLLGRTVQTRTARSCAYRCSFCDYPIRAGKLALAAVDIVERELAMLHARGVANVVFVDDTFNVPEERFRALCAMMIRRRFGFRWFSYLRCGSIKAADTVALMRESGCAGVFLGIESGDPDVLATMDKASTAEQYRRGIAALHRHDILTFASFIAGFPGETERTLRNTIVFINEAQPALYRVEPWWYNHRSPIHRRARELGLTGQAYDWRHATMSASEACDGIDWIFQSVSSSWWCPQQSFSFWAIPYLMGKGMQRGEVVEWLRLLHGRLPRSTRPRSNGGPRVADDALDAFAMRLRLDDPRFVRPVRAPEASNPAADA
jgi:p-methyltransferase